MVSTLKRYKFDNFPVLRASVARGERLYNVRLYADRAAFVSVQSSLSRMRVILAFIESKTTVIDGLIEADESLDYLSVLCSSPAPPPLFSRIVNRAAPRAVIEEISVKRAEEHLANGAVRESGARRTIPHSGIIQNVNESRRILLGLLLEYRALLAECEHTAVPRITAAKHLANADFSIPFLLFELEGRVCGIPAYQVIGLAQGGYDTTQLRVATGSGERVITCSEVLCVKEINVPLCEFTERRKRGYYAVRSPLAEGELRFTLVVPSLL